MNIAEQDEMAHDIGREFAKSKPDPDRYFLENIHTVVLRVRLAKPRRSINAFTASDKRLKVTGPVADDLMHGMKSRMGASGKDLQVHATPPVQCGSQVIQQVVFGVPENCKEAFYASFPRPKGKRPRVNWGSPLLNSWVQTTR